MTGRTDFGTKYHYGFQLAAFYSSNLPNVKSLALLIPSLIVLSTAGFHQAASAELQPWEKQQKRLKEESIALFQAVLEKGGKDSERKPAPCELRAEWLDYAVPQGIAEKYFGLTIPADLSPSFTPGELPEILDPKGTMRTAFCSKKEDGERRHAMLESLKDGKLTDEKEPGTSAGDFATHRLEYTVPIFDRHYRRAIVITSEENSRWWFQDGKRRHYFDDAVWASIYVKRKGHWHLVKEETLTTGHGGN